MEKSRSDLTKLCLTGLPLAAVFSALSFLHSAQAAASVFLGSVLMIANVWVLARSLSGMLLEASPPIARSIALILLKVIGLFALSWIFLRYLGVHPVWFGASATLTIVALALAFGIRSHREALS